MGDEVTSEGQGFWGRALGGWAELSPSGSTGGSMWLWATRNPQERRPGSQSGSGPRTGPGPGPGRFDREHHVGREARASLWKLGHPPGAGGSGKASGPWPGRSRDARAPEYLHSRGRGLEGWGIGWRKPVSPTAWLGVWRSGARRGSPRSRSRPRPRPRRTPACPPAASPGWDGGVSGRRRTWCRRLWLEHRRARPRHVR